MSPYAAWERIGELEAREPALNRELGYIADWSAAQRGYEGGAGLDAPQPAEIDDEAADASI